MNQSYLDVAETVKNACIDAARDGFRDASMSGLCTQGAIEAAISAIQKLDVHEIVKKHYDT
jgi:hypothetical protein